MVFDVCHDIHGASLFEAQGFLLVWEEVFKKLILELHPFCLLKGGNIGSVVDPEHMLQVLLPTTAAKFCCQSCRIAEGRPWPTSMLSLGSFRCHWGWDRGQIALLTWWLCTHLPLHASGVADRSATTSLLSSGRSSMVLWTCAAPGGALSAGGWEATPLPVDFFGGCTASWYNVASCPGHCWWSGSAIWGAHDIAVDCVGTHWARSPGHCTVCALVLLPVMPLIMRDVATPGRLGGAAGSPLGVGALGDGSLQPEKSTGGRPSGGATYPGTPAAVLLGVVMPPEEAVTPYHGICSTIWLHVSVGARW